MNTRSLLTRALALTTGLLVAASGLIIMDTTPAHAAGTRLVTERFDGPSVADPAWRALGSACLTRAPNAQPPAGESNAGFCVNRTNAPAQSAVPGFLQLTDNRGNQAGGVVYNNAVPGNGGLLVEFDQWQYGGSAADGIGFFLTDGSIELTETGAPGGSLGYAQRIATGDEPGVVGGYVGVGLDAFGNFSNDNEGRGVGCDDPNRGPGQLPNSVALRGPGEGMQGYCYLAGTPNGIIPGQGLSLRGTSSADNQARSVRISVSADVLPLITVQVDFKDGVGFRDVLSYQMTIAAPSTYKFGFLGSTGGSTDTHLIRNVQVSSLEVLGDLNIVKQIDNRTPQPAAYAEGDTIPYSFVVSNTSGLATLTDVTVVDADATNIVCPSTVLGPVDPTTPVPSSMTCTGEHVVTPEEALTGEFTNTATATGLDGGAPVESNESSVTVAIATPAPALTLAKRAVLSDTNANGFADVGESISYFFDVTNSGNVTIEGISILDEQIDSVTPATATLAPGGTATFEATEQRVVTQADIDSGADIQNVATATGQTLGGTPVESAPSPADVEVVSEAPSLTMDKAADPTTVSAVGQQIAYEFAVTNTGNVRIDGISIDDADFGGSGPLSAIECPVTTLAVSEATTCTASYTVTADDLELDEISNTAAAQGTSSRGTAVRSQDSTADVTVAVPGFSLTKESSSESGAVVNPGDVVTYTITASNTGETPLGPVTVADDLSGVLASAVYNDDATATLGDAPAVEGDELSWSGALAVGESVEITYSVTVDATAGGETLSNSVAASATPPGGDPIIPTPVTTTDTVLQPGFELTKTSLPGDGASVDAGDVIEYSILARNSGETVLDPVTVSDDLSGILQNATFNGDLAATIGTPIADDGAISWTGALAAGEQVVITYSVTIAADAAGAVLTNAAQGSAVPPGGATITPPTSETTHVVTTPGFSLAKSSTPPSGAAIDPGQTITYTVTGVNTGETILDPVSLSDDLSAVLDGATYNDDATASAGDAPVVEGTELTWSGALEIGETVTITYSVTVDADAGGASLVNRVTASATPPGGIDLTPTPATTTHGVNLPGFSLSKSVAPDSGTAVNAGDELTYTLRAVNTGETSLDPVVVDDDLSGVLASSALSGAPTSSLGDAPTVDGTDLSWTGSLGVGAEVVITYTVIVDEDAAGATLGNSVTGSATPPGGATIVPPVSTTSNDVLVPGFELTKTAAPAAGTPVDAGSVITYTVTGVNTGETPLEPVTIDDDLSGVLENASLSGSPTSTIGSAPTVDGTDLTWTGALDVGQTVVLSYSVLVDADAAGQNLTNAVTASATPPGGPVLTPPVETTSHDVNVPGFTLVKTVDPDSGAEVHPGDVLSYTVTATNTGETVLDPVQIRDDLANVLGGAAYNGDAEASSGADPTFEDGAIAWDGSLEVGAELVLTYSVTVTRDAPGSSLRNSVVGEATTPGGGTIVPPPSTTINDVPLPGFTLAKTSDPADGGEANPGDTITYTVTASNTGETVLDPVSVRDDLSQVLTDAVITGEAIASLGDAPRIDGTELAWDGVLGIGESVVITYQVTVSGDAAGATLVNSVDGSATPPGGEPIVPPTETTTSIVPVPGFSLVKSVDAGNGGAVSPGDVLRYTLTGTNTGATVLDPVEISDDLSGVLSAASFNDDATSTVGDAPVLTGTGLDWSGSLESGQTVVITYSVTVDAGAAGTSIVNSVTGVATPPGGEPIVPPVSTTENTVPVPGFTLEKVADPSDGSSVMAGQTITYTVTGTNTGETALDPVEIVDDLSRVLDKAEVRGPIRASLGEQPQLSGTTLTWVGSLDAGERVVLTYTVVVDVDAAGTRVENSVGAVATPPGGPAISAEGVTTTNPVTSGLATSGAEGTPLMLAGILALLAGLGLAVFGGVRRRRRTTA